MKPVVFALLLLLLVTGCGGEAAGQAAPVVDVALGDMVITPGEITAVPGPLDLRVTNTDVVVHDLVVAGKGTRRLGPGETVPLPRPHRHQLGPPLLRGGRAQRAAQGVLDPVVRDPVGIPVERLEQPVAQAARMAPGDAAGQHRAVARCPCLSQRDEHGDLGRQRVQVTAALAAYRW